MAHLFEAPQPKILGYYVYQRNLLQAKDIDPFLCTHIVFAHAEVRNGELSMTRGEDVKPYRQLATLKEKNPKLKILLSVKEGLFEFIVNYRGNLSGFFKQAIIFLKEYEFDGIELSVNNPKLVDKSSLSIFLLEFHEALLREVRYKNRQKLLMSVSLPSTRTQLMTFDFSILRKVIDFATATTYDLNTAPKKTCYHSPLHTGSGDNKFFTVAGLVDFFIELGLPPSKLLWGLPTYGRSYRLHTVTQHGVKARSEEVGDPGPILRIKGLFTYEEVGMTLRNGAVRVYDERCCVPYLYDGKLWVTFEDPESATEKALYFKDKLAGVAIWNLTLGDPKGKINGTKFPIVQAVKTALLTKDK
ncbi:chitinase-3-like protein 1 [Octopus sinensis]|uniref:Chitinase-3-like protein 1 n=1 Tax=Octopus sinensis TaxID=2607531 RepID=A0A6P7SBR9_9MOLL|nr:chitinase-3-like protein 1 [Octopus sinensis]XP_029635830.1 chitinase-3-like protein 1 [Octopus sinensis]